MNRQRLFCFALGILGVWQCGLAIAAPRRELDVPLRLTYEQSSDPLTTEKFWTVDPDELNPHRQRWALQREIELKGLKAVEKKQDQFGVDVTGIEAIARSFVRGPGPWFQTIQDFRCEHEPQAWFATAEGVRKAADRAAEVWQEIVKSEKLKLSAALERITADTGAVALKKAQLLFRLWVDGVNSEWRAKARHQARMTEWRSYLEAASDICKPDKMHERAKAKKDLQPIPTWESMMEPLKGEPPTQLYARAPARRWNGLFSVRLNMKVATKKINGQFLIDSAAGTSVISPIWLRSQGVPPDWVEVPGAAPQRVTWSGGGGLARRAYVDFVEMSGYRIPVSEFVLIETELFGPPDNLSSCCDGILGSDFLRKFVVEFHPGPPAEIKIWPKEGFRHSEGTPWVEVALTPSGEPVSNCVAQPETAGPKGKPLALGGVRWDTGSEEALDIHTPWQKAAQAQHAGPGTPWEIRCGSLSVGQFVPVTFPSEKVGEGKLFSSKVPAVNLGMPLLARGNFTFDLPHGRLWFAKESLKEPVSQNRSGLQVEYKNINGERSLVVKSLRGGTPAADLARSGLKPGTIITYVDSKPAEDIDLWEVEERLAGKYGETVTLEWNAKQGIKVVGLAVR